MPANEVLIGDLEDLEMRAKDCDLLITNSHGRQMADRLHLPFLRFGIPTFDRLGAAHKLIVGYRGTKELVFELANTFLAEDHEVTSDSWNDRFKEIATELSSEAPTTCASNGSCTSCN